MMENVISQLFTLPNLILCLMIWVLVWVQRRVVEEAWKGAKTNKFWNELALPLLPLVTGGVIGAAVPEYPYPADFKTFWARVFFAIVCGLISAHAYKIVKNMIKKEAGDTSGGTPNPEDILDEK